MKSYYMRKKNIIIEKKLLGTLDVSFETINNNLKYVQYSDQCLENYSTINL